VGDISSLISMVDICRSFMVLGPAWTLTCLPTDMIVKRAGAIHIPAVLLDFVQPMNDPC
jgi:hypothetical protein